MRDTDPRVRKGQTVDAVDHRSVNWIEGLWFGALDAPGAPDEQDAQEHDGRLRDSHREGLPNGSRLSCGRNGCWRKALERQTKRLAGEGTQFFPHKRPAASSAC